ncbi:TRPM8 channel-associated factor homolog [Exaiptasia diaphana]|uniref:Peptidase M60 domain-containing protein n=1 Tax=Exaiptasia diaphana TaxID=2652724 RepID=A0A913WVX1_EXADI|nr:TRPM8 channel-associated factor homolog [Exaiptasia diaphana]KXJ20900.1 TRPM8 channel-associated factor-like [Exaiptasia diaphana]
MLLTKAPDHWSKWQNDILNGIDCIPKTGVPGKIIAYGDNAVPILTGDEIHELILTASQCGKGKIVVFSHNGYIGPFIDCSKEFSSLVRNIKKWATNGVYTQNDNTVLNITEETSIEDLNNAKYKLLIWGCDEQDDDFIKKMLNVVKDKGVGLVMGMCPWGWRQLNNDRPLEEACFSPVLDEAGVCYTSDYTDSGEDGGFLIEHNLANQAHLGLALSNLKENFKNASEEHIQLLQHAIPNLPDKIWRDLSSKFTKMLSSFKHIIKPPSPKHPVSDNLEKLLLSIQARELRLSASEGVSIPGCECFPGNFSEFNNFVGSKVSLRITARFKNEWHCTGCYIPAGWKLVVTATNGDFSNWSLRIGSHSDELHFDDDWKRWPNVCTTKTLTELCTELVSPFGGLVYLNNSNEGTLEVQLENILEAPLYDLTNPALCATWERRRQAPGLWAELAGEHIIFTLPSSSVRELTDPLDCLRLWDKVVYSHHHLKGSNPLEQKRERVVCDVQPSAGYMHSGYPVVTHLDITEVQSKEFVMNPVQLRGEGSWGLYHELGHNMQDDAWTFDGTTEVTCNIFTLHAMQMVSGRKPWIHSWLQGQLTETYNYLSNGTNFDDWKESPGVALFIYAQLIQAFGWDSFKTLFRKYTNESIQPESNQEKIDLWFSLFSEVVGYNILPMAMFWGIPITESVSELLQASDLKLFLPDDELTNHESALQRISVVKSKFGKLVRNVAIVDSAPARFGFDERSQVVRNPSVIYI